MGYDGAVAVGREDGEVIDNGEQEGASRHDHEPSSGSYGSSLSLENVMVTSEKFRGTLSPSLVSKGVERERSEVGRLRQAEWPPGHGRSIAGLGRRFGDLHHIPSRWK